MKCKEFVQQVQSVMSSANITAGYIRRMVKMEREQWGDEAEALRSIANAARVSFWTLNNIKIGRAKTVDGDLKDRIREAFIRHCRGHAERLLHEAALAEKAGRNDDLAALADKIRAYASELDAAAGEAKTFQDGSTGG